MLHFASSEKSACCGFDLFCFYMIVNCIIFALCYKSNINESQSHGMKLYFSCNATDHKEHINYYCSNAYLIRY